MEAFEIGLVAVSVSYGCHDKIPQMGWLKQQKLVFSQFWRLEVQGQGAAALVSPEAYRPGLQMAAFSLCPHTVFPLCVHTSLVYLYESKVPLFLRTPVRMD